MNWGKGGSTKSSSPATERQELSHKISFSSASGCSSPHVLTWRSMQWVVGELAVWTEHWWSCYPGNTLTLWSQPPLTWLCFLDAAWRILCGKLNITLDVVFLDRKCSFKVRKMINILPKQTQIQKSSQREKWWPSFCRPRRADRRCFFISFFVLRQPEAGRMWCKTGMIQTSIVSEKTITLNFGRKCRTEYLRVAYNFCKLHFKFQHIYFILNSSTWRLLIIMEVIWL